MLDRSVARSPPRAPCKPRHPTPTRAAATISSGTALDAANPNLLTPATITFTSPTTYSINGGANQAYTRGGNIAFNGWQVQISGSPATGDTFTVQSNAGGTGDNRNALGKRQLSRSPGC